jgi:hypothetical protein
VGKVKGCGPQCFTGPTIVWTERGLVPIADIQVGDLVLAHNDETGELSFREVLKTYVRQGAPIVLVTLMAVDPAVGNTLTTIETTEEHPFLVEATANGDMPGWTRVDELSPGDTIKQFDGLSPGSVVMSVQFTSRREQVHNLEVEGLHTYLVGADGVVVHNGSGCPLNLAGKQLEDHVAKQWGRSVIGRNIKFVASSGERGEIDIETASHFIEVTGAASLTGKVPQLRKLAAYAREKGKQGVMLLYNPNNTTTASINDAAAKSPGVTFIPYNPH